MFKPLAAKTVIKVLCREFGFCFVSQKGSHVKLKKKVGVREVATVISLHRRAGAGNLKGDSRIGRS